MRILITGNAGYLGQAVARLLAANGHEVVGVDNDLYKSCLLDAETHRPTLQIKRDIRDLEPGHFKGVGAVIHLAGLCNESLVRLNPHLTFEVNIEGALAVARAARAAGTPRFVFASSCDVYGAAAGQRVDEDAPLHPDSAYGESKVFVEAELAKLASEHFCPVSLRLPDVYGFSPRMRFDLTVNGLAGRAAATGRVQLRTPPADWLPILHVDDAAEAFRLAATAPSYQVWSEALNVGSEEAIHRTHDIAETIARHFGGAPVEFALERRPRAAVCRPSFQKIRERLSGFQPAWDLERGVIQMRDAFFKRNVTAVDIEGPRFDRLAHLRWLFDAGSLTENLRWTAAAP